MKSFSLASLPHAILSFCLYLSLLRGTNMGLFYPAAENEIGAIDYTFQMIMNLMLLIGVTAYFFLKNDYHYLISRFSSAIFGLLAFGVSVSLICSVDRIESAKYVLAFLVVSLPTVLYCHEHGFEKLLKAYAKFMTVIAFLNLAYIFAFPQHAIMAGNHAGAWRGMFEHKNPAGAIMGLGTFIILLQVDVRHKMQFLFYLGGATICLVFTILSHSSTALVTTSVMIICYASFYFLMHLKSSKERVLVVLVLSAISVLLYSFAGDAIIKFVFGLIDRDPSLTGRTGIWSAIFDLLAERPLVGYGPGMSERYEFMQQIQGEVGWEVKSMHNSYLDMLTGYGYPVTILFFLYLFSMIGKALLYPTTNRNEAIKLAFSASMIVNMLFECFAESGGFLSRTIIWLFILCAFCVISEIVMKRKDNLPPQSV